MIKKSYFLSLSLLALLLFSLTSYANNSISENSFMAACLQAFGVLLREGFEALLIITALLAYLHRANHADKASVIYYGVGAAVIASIITAYLFATIFKHLGSSRDAVEGVTMLIAAVLLFYVSYWLLSKREANKWQHFIKQKMQTALSSSSMFALGLTAFLAVYREGAETILFYQALIIQNPGQTTGLAAGFTIGCLALIALYFIIQKAAFKIPYRLFFTVTAIFLYYMAFCFIGEGILELQEASWISITPIAGFPTIEWLGIFPTWQSIIVQSLFLVVTLGGLCWWYAREIIKSNRDTMRVLFKNHSK